MATQKGEGLTTLVWDVDIHICLCSTAGAELWRIESTSTAMQEEVSGEGTQAAEA